MCTAAALLLDAIDVAGVIGTAHSFSASARGSQSVNFGAWVDAGDLAVGDQVWSREIGFAEVEAVEQRPALQPLCITQCGPVAMQGV